MPENNEKTEEKKEEKPQSTTLESIINETSQAGKGLANTALGAGAIAGTAALFGQTGLAIGSISPFSRRVSNKLAGKDFTSKDFRNGTIESVVMTPTILYTIRAIRNIPAYLGITGLVNYGFAVGGLTLAAIPFYSAVSFPVGYLFRNKSFKGLGGYLKENYWKKTKKTLSYLGLPGAAAVALSSTMPILAPLLIPAFIGLGIAYRTIQTEEKLDYKKLFYPSTYIPNFLNPFYITRGAASSVGKTYSRITTAFYDLGSVVRDSFKKTTAAPTEAPKPA